MGTDWVEGKRERRVYRSYTGIYSIKDSISASTVPQHYLVNPARWRKNDDYRDLLGTVSKYITLYTEALELLLAIGPTKSSSAKKTSFGGRKSIEIEKERALSSHLKNRIFFWGGLIIIIIIIILYIRGENVLCIYIYSYEMNEEIQQNTDIASGMYIYI